MSGRGLPRARSTHWWAGLLVLTLAGGLLRLGVLELVQPLRAVGDEVYYAVVAHNIARGKGHTYGPRFRALRPPAQPWVLSHVLDPERPPVGLDETGRVVVRSERLLPLLRVQVALGTLLIACVGLLGRALFDARTGLVAAGAAALYPTFVAYSHYLWAETLFALLVTAGLAAAVRTGRWYGAVATGLLLGAATLAREAGLLAAGVVALWWWGTAGEGRRAAAAGRGALLLAAAAAVVLPWTLRNAQVVGRFVPVATVGWLALGEGNALEERDWLHPSGPNRSAYRRAFLSLETEAEQVDFARRRVPELVAEQQPGWLPKKLVRNLAQLFAPDSFLLYKLRYGGYGGPRPALERALVVATVLSYTVVALAGVLGIAAAGRRRAALGGLLFGAVAAAHVLANANSRFRFPWMPLLMVYAAHAFVARRSLAERVRGRARVAAAAVAAFYLLVCVPYFCVYSNATVLWSRGEEAAGSPDADLP